MSLPWSDPRADADVARGTLQQSAKERFVYAVVHTTRSVLIEMSTELFLTESEVSACSVLN